VTKGERAGWNGASRSGAELVKDIALLISERNIFLYCAPLRRPAPLLLRAAACCGVGRLSMQVGLRWRAARVRWRSRQGVLRNGMGGMPALALHKMRLIACAFYFRGARFRRLSSPSLFSLCLSRELAATALLPLRLGTCLCGVAASAFLPVLPISFACWPVRAEPASRRWVSHARKSVLLFWAYCRY